MTDISTKPKTGRYALPSDLYDSLKETQQIFLPALGTLYAALGGIWGFPFVVQIVGTIAAITAFLGVTLKISTVSYNNSDKSTDGKFLVDKSDPLTDRYTLDVGDIDLGAISHGDTITLKVQDVVPELNSQN